ncbi:MAG: hypothetical protein HZB51_15040 [Chloroflexi bacterium]|nr:hypothetical protein [Chloroflexota bacterium]
MISISPKLGDLLVRTTQTPDLDTALWKVLSEYIDLKIAALSKTDMTLQEKWRMSFDEFSNRMRAGTLGKDSYSWKVEQDFWEWEQTTTLLKQYESLKTS